MTNERVLQPLLLPEGVLATPVAELPGTVRERLHPEDGDVVLTRVGARSTSRVVSGATWELIDLFQNPMTIVEAVLSYSRVHDLEPSSVLEEATPVVVDLLNARLLAVAGSAEAGGREPLLAPGSVIDRIRITQVVQVQEDVDVYRGDHDGTPVAVKLARTSSGPAGVAAEAELLTRLEGLAVPRVIARGRHGELDWFAATWLDARPVFPWAADLERSGQLDEAVRGFADLAAALAALHERGVVHGDLHGGNVVMLNGMPMLLDLGGARVGDVWPGPHRALDGHYTEPELARARLAGARDVPPTAASEQFAFGVLVYTALTGAHPFDLPLDRELAMRRIVEGGMVPFAHQGVRSRPTLERVLARTLAVEPAERYASLADVATELRRVSPEAARAPRGTTDIEQWWRRTIARYDDVPDAALLQPHAPTCSVYWGAAGVALGLVTVARLAGDADLLAAAVRWAAFARFRSSDPDAYESAALGLPPGLRDQPTLLHGRVGAVLVEGLVGAQVGMEADVHRAAEALVAALTGPDPRPDDPTLGATSLLWGAAALVEHTAGEVTLPLSGLRAAVAARLRVAPVRPDDGYLGMAHGEAGICHAHLRAAMAFGLPAPGWVPDMLNGLAGSAHRVHGRASWPLRRADSAEPWAGWCHGSAGHAQVFALAARVLGQDRWADLAVEAAEYAAHHPNRAVASLCCGTAGQAATFLDLHELSGETVWLDRAAGFVERAMNRADQDRVRASLFKGDLGVAVVAAAVTAQRPAFPLLGS